jgi:hypothetical protein
LVKRQLKIVKRFGDAQKRQWEKKDAERGKPKNKFKKYFSKYPQGRYSLRVTNSDKIRDELLKRGMEFLPEYLLSLPVPEAPPAATLVVPASWGGKRDDPRTLSMGLESDEDWLRRMGLY